VHAIHNARVQMGATALNNLGVAAMVAGIISPWVNNGAVGDAPHIGAWFAFGASCMLAAQLLLGRLR
jgi:hypothetical protein